MAYFALIAALLGGDGISFFLILFGLVCSVAFCGGILLWWMTLWASRKESRLGQFTVGSLLFATFFLALFCGIASSCVLVLESFHGTLSPETKILIWIFCAVGVLISFCPGLLLLEVLLRTATWMVKRRWIQRWLFRRSS
ncbi:MAG: hypothetical protein JXB10_20150 [Pirellulales bacterium]|nr:hypothetical protein [Pirellulales bacterium]